MARGDVRSVDAHPDLYYVDTGMYETDSYGVVYILDADRPTLVDSGIGTHYERILEALESLDIQPRELEAIALTHVHLDHAGGAGFLADACPNATVYVHDIGAPHLVDPSALVDGTKRAVGEMWDCYTDPEPLSEDRIEEFEAGDTIDLGNSELEAHHVPGHAPHQVVFEDNSQQTVFTADAAGLWVPARETVHPTSPPPNFELDQCLEDVETIRGLEPELLCYPHFGPGPADADSVLLEYETVLDDWVEAVKTMRTELDSDEAVCEHFADATDYESVWGERKAREEARLNARGVLHFLDQAGQ